jgi:hypothetical protein
LALVFFLVEFLALNFILGPDGDTLLRGGLVLVLLGAVTERVDFFAVFRGDLRVVFFAGMINLVHRPWEI